MRKKAVGIVLIGSLALIAVAVPVTVLARRPSTRATEQPAPFRPTVADATTTADKQRFDAALARLQAEGAALDQRKLAEEALVADAERIRAERWEAEEGAKNEAINAEQLAQTDASIKSYDESVAAQQVIQRLRAREARAENLARAEAESAARQQAGERREQRQLALRAVAAAEEQATAASRSAAAAATAAEAAQAERYRDRTTHCTTSYDRNGNAYTTCQ